MTTQSTDLRPPSLKTLALELSHGLGRNAPAQVSNNEHEKSQSHPMFEPGRSLSRYLPTRDAWTVYFTHEVAFDWNLSFQMYGLTLSTGILDVTTYRAFTVFATKMTGNLVLLAIDALGDETLTIQLEQNVATAIGAFLIGAVAFGHLGRLVGRRRRLYLLTSNLFSTCMILGATALQYWGEQRSVGVHAVVTMFLIAFAMAGQVSLAVGVGLTDINTTIITTALVQLCYDPGIFHKNNVPRTRRLGFVLIMASGHFIGATASKRSTSLGLLLTAVVKGMVTLSFLLNPGMVRTATQDIESGSQTKEDVVKPAAQILWGD